MHEVVVGGAAGARDQTDPERDRSEHEPGVAIEQAVGRERAQDPLAVGGDPAHREHGIDGAHDELELALVHADPAADAHLHVVAELGAGHLRERAGDRGAVVVEQHGVDAGADAVAGAGGLLHQREVGVAARVALQVLHLAPHPHLLRKGAAQGVAHLSGELADGKGGDLGDIPEVERFLAHRALRLTHPCDTKTLWERTERARQTRAHGRYESSSCGAGVVLEPLQLAHVDELVAAATEDRSTYGFTWVPHDAATMRAYVETALADEQRGWSLPFVVRLRASDRVVGTSRFIGHRLLDRIADSRRRGDRQHVARGVGAGNARQSGDQAPHARSRVRMWDVQR